MPLTPPAPASHRKLTPAGPHSRLAALDGLRLCAALAVVSFHYVSRGQGFWHAEPGGPVFRGIHLATAYGWMGVELFFIISGFVICMSSWGRGLGEFFVSRVARLYPAFWAGILFTSIVLTVLPSAYTRLPWSEIVTNLTMFQAALGARDVDGSYWTLWREILFYLLFAIVVWRGVNYRRVVLFCALWTTGTVIAVPVNNPALSMVVDQEYSMYFIAGVTMYLMHRFKPTPLLWGILGFSLLIAVRAVEMRLPGMATQAGEPQNWYVAASLVVTFYGAVLGIALGWLSRIRWGWLTTAGALTYPLYVIHGYAGFAVISHFSTKLPRYPLLFSLIVCMLVVAWLIYRFVERPLSRLLRLHLTTSLHELRIASRPTGPPPRQDESTLAGTVPAPRREIAESGRVIPPPLGLQQHSDPRDQASVALGTLGPCLGGGSASAH